MIETAVRTHEPEIAGCQPRIGDRRQLRMQGRLTWRDANGALRFVSVITCDVSDVDAYVECQTPTSIAYRVWSCRATTGTPHGYALRLLVNPATQTNGTQTPRSLTTLH